AAKGFGKKMDALAMERVGQELTKILTSPKPRLGLELLDNAGLVEALLPELLAMKGCTQPPEFHPEGDVWEHTLGVLQALPADGPHGKALAWAALLHDMAKPATRTVTDRIRFHGHESLGAERARAVCERMKLSHDLTEAVATLVADHLRLDPIKQMKLATLKRLLRRDDLEDLLRLHKADCLGSHGNLELYDYARARQKEFEGMEASQGLRPAPLIDGADLIAWGYVPGPAFKEILGAVEDEQLEGRLADKTAAKHFVEAQYPRN
ncbi:MAG TPA: HD domain-containing protein, partial [bacterium]|nr:HD domain-containing protein [bacterium]